MQRHWHTTPGHDGRCCGLIYLLALHMLIPDTFCWLIALLSLHTTHQVPWIMHAQLLSVCLFDVVV